MEADGVEVADSLGRLPAGSAGSHPTPAVSPPTAEGDGWPYVRLRRKVKRRRRRKLGEVKIVIRKRADGTTWRIRGAQATAAFCLGFATAGLLLGNVLVFAVFAVVAVVAAAWDMGYRVFVRQEPPQ